MSAASTTIAARLAAVVPPRNVIEAPADLATYEIDGQAPAAAVIPGSAEEIAEIVRFAASASVALIPCGARTKIRSGLPPRRYDLALDLSRLDRIVAYDPGDLTLSVEAGIPLVKLAAALAERGQFLPLLVPYFRASTVGGAVASGVDSPLRQSYGTVRDYLLGMELVTGEGRLVKSGGRVVKNVTGYDLHKLLIGSFGTLGIITRINFRTFPRPASTRAVIAWFETAERALEMRHRIARSPLSPVTLEILSPQVAGLFAGEGTAQTEPASYNPKILSSEHWALVASFAGNPEVLKRYAACLIQTANETGATHVEILEDIPERHELSAAFARMREFVPIALASSPAAMIMKIGALPHKMKDVLVVIEAAGNAAGLKSATLARGVGILYCALLPSSLDSESRRLAVQVTDAVVAAAAEAGGHATIPYCPGEWKSELKIWGLERDDLDQMKKLKNLFDPCGVLSPGRLAGGI